MLPKPLRSFRNLVRFQTANCVAQGEKKPLAEMPKLRGKKEMPIEGPVYLLLALIGSA
jgi:hypothetical protein